MSFESEGKSLKAGEILSYVITDYYYHHRDRKLARPEIRAIPVELFDEKANTYDVRRYTELVKETCNSVTEPFGYTLTHSVANPLPQYFLQSSILFLVQTYLCIL